MKTRIIQNREYVENQITLAQLRFERAMDRFDIDDANIACAHKVEWERKLAGMDEPRETVTIFFGGPSPSVNLAKATQNCAGQWIAFDGISTRGDAIESAEKLARHCAEVQVFAGKEIGRLIAQWKNGERERIPQSGEGQMKPAKYDVHGQTFDDYNSAESYAKTASMMFGTTVFTILCYGVPVQKIYQGKTHREQAA